MVEMAAEPSHLEVPSWLKSLPPAPEYHPTVAEFRDPIAYILKIEREASSFGICKIVPPLPPPPKKSAAANLGRSFAARHPQGEPAFTTRQQQVGFCPRRPRPVRKPVWQSGEYYTLSQFEAKARQFERAYLRKCGQKSLSALEVETLFCKACADRPFPVEYANDIPGSGFPPVGNARKWREEAAGNVGETAWNMRGVSRAKGSLLRFMKEEIPGVTSPMVYMAMMFSWFAWHVEDHELHSLNYLHMGAGKTWYGVPRDARLAFEDVVRVQGYGEEINPLVTFATLGEKTTVMSPEVFISAGIPCCRLVQNAGEFVVTFPGAYHSGFSHGFNCGEAANIATPEWLKVAKEAAIRRASTNCPPMVSHFQLLYALALSLCSRTPISSSTEPRSSRLKDKMKGEGEVMVKDIFVRNMIENNSLLSILVDKGSSCIVLPRKTANSLSSSGSLLRSHVKVKPRLSLGLSSQQEALEDSRNLPTNNMMIGRNAGLGHLNGHCSMKGNSSSVRKGKKPLGKCSRFQTTDLHSSTSDLQSTESDKESRLQDTGSLDQGLLSCVTCGILSFACVAVVQPSEAAAEFLMSADCSSFNDQIVVSGEISDIDEKSNHGTQNYELVSGSGQLESHIQDRFNDNFIDHSTHSTQASDQAINILYNMLSQKETSALDLLASAYGNSSDSEGEELLHEMPVSSDQNGGRGSVLTCDLLEQLTSANSSQNLCSNKNSSAATIHLIGAGSHNGVSEILKNSIRLDSECELSVASSGLIGGSYSDRCVKDEDIYELHGNTESGLSHPCMDPGLSLNPAAPSDNVDLTEQKSNIDASARSPNLSVVQRRDKDSSRMHIFCLEHALEVEKQLHVKGGVHIMLLCHPEYLKLEKEAKLLSEELEMDHPWEDIPFREATKEDQERIQMALEDEEAIPTSTDWAVKMGINLYYSANLSKAPLYSKQMPYNTVIYKAFRCNSQGLSPVKPRVSRRKAGRQKKIVIAGKWCGKVWMSNQVHPNLAHRSHAEEDEDAEKLHGQTSNQETETASLTKSRTSRRSGRKRKKPSGKSSAKKIRCDQSDNSTGGAEDAAADSSEQCGRSLRSRTSTRKKIDCHKSKLKSKSDEGPSKRLRRRPKAEPVKSKPTNEKKSKNTKVKKSQASNLPTKEEEVEYPCDLEGCLMSFSTKQDLALHKRNICPVEGCRKKFFSHKYMVQHQKVHVDDRPLKCPWRGCKMSFKWPWARTEHIRVHTGDRPYICREAGCGQTFRFVSDFSRHKRKTGHVSAKRKRG